MPILINRGKTSFGPNIVTSGLVLYLDAANTRSYPGTGTTWTDLSGNGNNGTLTNGPTFDGGNGGSIVFDGSNDYIDLGNKFRYQDNFSIEIWAKYTTLPNNPGTFCGARHPIIANNDYGYNLLIYSSGVMGWVVYDTFSTGKSVLSTTSVISQNYFHAVCMKSGTTILLYLNSVLQGTETLTSNSVYYVNIPFSIGGNYVCGGNYFYSTGNISLVKIYNRALSASEVLQNYNATKSRFNL